VPKTYKVRMHQREYDLVKEYAEEKDITYAQAVSELMTVIKRENEMLKEENQRLRNEVARGEAYYELLELSVYEKVEEEVGRRIDEIRNGDI